MDERKDMRWHGGSDSRRHAKETAGGYSREIQVRWDEGSVQLFRPRYGIRSSGSGLRDSRRPTFSFSSFYQWLGRAVRIKDSKDSALVVDCCNNSSRFGDIRKLSIENYKGYGWGCLSAIN